MASVQSRLKAQWVSSRSCWGQSWAHPTQPSLPTSSRAVSSPAQLLRTHPQRLFSDSLETKGACMRDATNMYMWWNCHFVWLIGITVYPCKTSGVLNDFAPLQTKLHPTVVWYATSKNCSDEALSSHLWPQERCTGSAEKEDRALLCSCLHQVPTEGTSGKGPNIFCFWRSLPASSMPGMRATSRARGPKVVKT